jgi:hypothetical protein
MNFTTVMPFSYLYDIYITYILSLFISVTLFVCETPRFAWPCETPCFILIIDNLFSLWKQSCLSILF